MKRRTALTTFAGVAFASAKHGKLPKKLDPARIVTLRQEADWYQHSAGLAAVGNELICTYRRSDEHIASISEIWSCRSRDGGRTWIDHQLLSASSFEKDQACWVAPQLGKTRQGRLLLLSDRGKKLTKFDWPMLSQWQQPPRGMSNHLWTSDDRGKTWTGPRQIDTWGGEPSYIIELEDGSLVYTRTDSQPTTAKKYPSMPWGPNYYRSTAVFSRDGGQTWNETHPVFDDPLIGDCEVGLAEFAPNQLVAISRIGDGGGRFGQPSRRAISRDGGRSWSEPELFPVYAQRPIIGKLANGKLFMSYRNAWGTPGTCVFAFEAGERFAYQPNSFIWDESVCRLDRRQLTFASTEGNLGCCEFTLYPVEDDESRVEFAAEVMIESAGPEACLIGAGVYVRLLPERVELADRPAEGFAVARGRFHQLRIVNHGPRVEVWLNGEKKLDASTQGIHNRQVRFGNRVAGRRPGNAEGQRNDTKRPLAATLYRDNAGVSHWRMLRVQVQNRRDHSIDWSWNPKQGYPDQFRRDRVLMLEPNGTFSPGNSGYSAWAQLPSGEIVVVDYTSANPPKPHPVLRSYRLDPGWFA
ncbi:MAG: glycoside hydrolase [Bryobacteraceae bacterium]|nr:glycoside hydrolase [Bryobacteraceae bacterium]